MAHSSERDRPVVNITESVDDGKRQFVTKMSKHGAESATGVKPPTSYCTTLIHLIKGYIGTGIFATPEAFRNSGMLLGPPIFVIIAILNLHCQHMLIKAAIKVAEEEEEDVRPTFAETVEYTLESSKIEWIKVHSKRLGTMTNIFLVVSEMGFCCVYFVFISEHLLQISTHHGFLKDNPYGIHVMLTIILLPLWTTTLLNNLKLLLPLSLVANMLMCAAVTLIYYFLIRDINYPSTFDLISDPQRFPLFFGTVLYAFEGITFVIPLRNEMGHPEKFISWFGVLNVGICTVVVLLLSVGTLGYITFGNDIKSSVFENLDTEELLAEIGQGLVVIPVCISFTLHMYIPFEISYPLFHRKYGPFKYPSLIMILYKSVPVLLTYTMANVIPFLGLFITLIGATTGSTLSFILPPIMEMIAFQGQLSIWVIIKDVFIMIIGVIGGIIATITTVYEIINKFRAVYQ